MNDLFPGFESRHVETADGRFFLRRGGSGAPLLLLHGYPQTHAEWHAITPRLAERFEVIAMDLRGYGDSMVPASREGDGMSKRAMGADAVAVMAALGHERFHLVGHDRGGRVAYRLAFDQPDRIARLAVIDIIPTAAMFEDMGRADAALSKYHWLFLAQPEPFPETMIGPDPRFFLEHTLASWTKAKNLTAFDPSALDHYRRFFTDPTRLRATCEDYRAGLHIDRLQDEADRKAGHKIAAPLLVLWGDKGIPSSGIDPLDVWRDYASDVRGASIPSGHFVPEENPDACADALLAFFAA